MRKTGILAVVIFLVMFGLFMVQLTSAQTTKPADVIHWKGQSCFPSTVAPYGPFGPGQTGTGAHGHMWSDWVKKATNGRLVIDWAEPGAIFPIVESDIAVAKNVVQISATYPSYYAGRIPESDVETGGVFQWENEEQVFECMNKYGLASAIKKVYEKRNLKWLPFHQDALVGLGTTFQAPNPASIKGKKIRAVGMWSDYIRMLGGSPVSLPWGEIYMAMKLGTIDGSLVGSGTLEELKLKEVVKSWVFFPRVSSAFCNFIINMDAWKALPQDLQILLERDTPYVIYALSSNYNNQCTWILKNSEQKYGVKLHAWSSEDAQKLTQQAVEEIYPRIAAKSKDTAELLEIVKKQMRDYGRIK